MKKRNMMLFGVLAAALAATGCGAKENTETPETVGEELTAELPEEELDTEDYEEDTLSGTDLSYLEWLPEGVEQKQSEAAANEDIKNIIAQYYEIPEDAWEETRYYYNYVDLNEDGTEEAFVTVLGSWVGGSGGLSALWIDMEELSVIQAFTQMDTPVIVSDEMTDGYHGLILRQYGDGDEEGILLTNKNGVYTNVSDAATVESLEEVTGTAILCNDLAGDLETGNYLTLAD